MLQAMKGILTFIITVISLASMTSACAQCNGGHTTSPGDMWLSCTGANNPNPARSQQHWILYDFGAIYFLNESHLWNYNVPGTTGNGLQNITIDYSTNGSDWSLWGDYSLSEANGSDDYEGESGPSFEGIEAQFLLISVTSNHGGNCYGFSELKIDVDFGSVQVDEPSLAALQFGLYPNPTRDLCTIQLENFNEAEIRILNVAGSLLRTTRPESATTRMDVSALPAGIYMVQVVNDQGQSAVKRLAVTD